MQKPRKGSQETIGQPWGRVLVPPQGIYITISLSFSIGIKAPTRMDNSNFRLSTRFLKHHHANSSPTNQKSHTLQSSPQILPIKTLPWKPSEFTSYEYSHPFSFLGPCNKPFSVSNSSVSVWPHCVSSIWTCIWPYLEQTDLNCAGPLILWISFQ